VDRAKAYIVFCGGGKAPVQRWELARYAAVLEEVHESLQIPVVAIGGEGELQEYRAEVLPRFPDLHVLPAPLPFRALCELMRSAFMSFGNDTGPMHVAAAVGCPTAVVMSSRNTLGAWDPDAHPALVIRHPTPCQGCFLVECTTHAHRCMTEITPRRVSADVQTFARRLAGVRRPHLAAASGGL
jgi:ADP-heptose:LPS heptosyltransferase